MVSSFSTLFQKTIRNLTNVKLEVFKSSLDSHLMRIPDEPQITGYTACRRASTNSLISMNNVQ